MQNEKIFAEGSAYFIKAVTISDQNGYTMTLRVRKRDLKWMMGIMLISTFFFSLYHVHIYHVIVEIVSKIVFTEISIACEC